MQIGSAEERHWFYLAGRDYLKYLPYLGTCRILILPEVAVTTDMWLLGDPFLRAYYSVYDLDSMEVGLTGVAELIRDTYRVEDETGGAGFASTGTRDRMNEAEEEEATLEADVHEDMGSDDEMTFEIIVIVCISVLIICLCCISNWLYYKYKRRKALQESQ